MRSKTAIQLVENGMNEIVGIKRSLKNRKFKQNSMKIMLQNFTGA